MTTTITTTWPELPEDVQKAIADINAKNTILLAYLRGAANCSQDYADALAVQIHDTCQKLMSE